MTFSMPDPLPLAALAAPFAAAATAFQRGGPVMWPLLACSLVAHALALERALVMVRHARRVRRGRATVERMLEESSAGRFDAALAAGEAADCPVCAVLADGLRHRDYGLADSLQAAANRELDGLRRGLSVLDTIITLGPLFGILGTVTGIIRSFHLLSAAGVEDPAAVTGGIAEALITTAAGLIVSILALVPFNAFVAYVRRVGRRLEEDGHRFEIACSRGQSHAPGNRI